MESAGFQGKTTMLVNCCVLLATFNGADFFESQIESIIAQRSDFLKVDIYISDDASTDRTKQLIQYYENSYTDIFQIKNLIRLGSAANNFFKLISTISLISYDYVALADQDDLWLPTKLHDAVTALKKHQAAAYSGSVTAFWESKKTALLNKAQAQVGYDYMFESAGPGCTFVLTSKLALEFQSFLIANQASCQKIALHDWFIYAFARSRGHKWHIDPKPHMLYRQHSANVVGANVGFKAAKIRWAKLRTGWLRRQSILLADILGYSEKKPMRWMRRYSFIDRIFLIAHIALLRRRWRDRIALAFSFLFPLAK
jgi:rhamnosyltransferase